jgi:hypothetical protein
VVADEGDLVTVVTNQTTQVFEACPPLPIIVGPLGGQLRNGVIVCRQLGSQVVRITDVKQPPIPLLDRHTTVPERVAEQRHQKYFGLESQFHRTSFQAEPFSNRAWIDLPIWAVGELRRNVPPVTSRDVDMLLLRYMHLSIREIGEATGVVGIAVCQDDVTHIGRRKTECFDPANGGVRFVELKARHVDQGLAQPFDRLLHILKADPGIDECEPFLILKQQTMADYRGVRRDHERSAIDVVDRRHKSLSNARA